MIYVLSDNSLVNLEVSLKKLPVKSTYKDVFLAELKTTCLVLDPPEELDQIVDLYNSTLMDLIEKLCTS